MIQLSLHSRPLKSRRLTEDMSSREIRHSESGATRSDDTSCFTLESSSLIGGFVVDLLVHICCINHDMKTLRILPSSHSSSFTPILVGSLTIPLAVPSFSFRSCSLSRPNTRPFGKTTGSSSIELVVWCAYGTFLASSFNSVEHIGQTGAPVLAVTANACCE